MTKWLKVKDTFLCFFFVSAKFKPRKSEKKQQKIVGGEKGKVVAQEDSEKKGDM